MYSKMGDKTTTASWLGHCAFGAAAPAAIFAGVQPSRLTLRGGTLSGGVAPGYSQYSLPGWIVLLAVNLDTLKSRRRRIVDLKKR